MNPKPVLEFVNTQRAPFSLDDAEIVVGRAVSSTLVLDVAGVGERHAKISVDPMGNSWIENFEADGFTMVNGQRLTGRKRLAEGDRIEIGLAALTFRAVGGAAALPAVKLGGSDRTMMGTEMPADLKAFLDQRKAPQMPAAQVQPQGLAEAWEEAPPTVMDQKAPEKAARMQHEQSRSQPRTVEVDISNIVADHAAGVIVGTPDPEPPASRTVQMSPVELPAAPAPAPTATPAPAQPFSAKRTMIGIGNMMPPKATPAEPAATQQKAPAAAATAFMEAPKLPAPVAAPQPETKAPPQAATAFMEAPKLPSSAGFPQPQPQQPFAQPAVAYAPTQPPPSGPAYPASPSAPSQAQPSPAYQAPPSAAYQAPPAAPAGAGFGPSASTGPSKPYVPHSHGAFGPFSRALEFMKQIFSLASQHKALLKPLLWDLFLTTPVMALFTVAGFFIHSANGWYALMGVEAFLLYFIDYGCNSITASLIYDYATTGQATLETAMPRVKKALPGIMTFAAVSALLDVATTYARERDDFVGRIVLRILRAIWTTATYVIMPALVIEGVSFGQAFGRAKKLMDQDPTGVGAGIVAMSLTSYIVAAVCYPLSYFLFRVGGYIHPAIGMLLGMLVVNLYWSVSGWMKISYSTCFYMWARECESHNSTDSALAPAPLRAALEAA